MGRIPGRLELVAHARNLGQLLLGHLERPGELLDLGLV